MKDYNQILEEAKNDIKKEKSLKRRKVVQYTVEQVSELFNLRLSQQMVKRGYDEETFVRDELNNELIKKLFQYIGLSSSFEGLLNESYSNSEKSKEWKDTYIKKGNLRKGLMIIGNLGSGKTLIMSAFCKLWEDVFNTRMAMITAKEYASNMIGKDKRIDNYNGKVLFIDDVGKEGKVALDFGTEKHPIGDLLDERYVSNNLTFVTGNYDLKTLEDHYGETITDRMIEMFNIIILKGESRRV